LTVTFDRPLAPGTSAVGNWVMAKPGLPATIHHNTAPAVVAGSTVTADMVQFVGPGPALGTCRYRGAPLDVRDTRNLFAAVFTDFPFVTIP
jgi:hypothetical protein